LKKKSAHHSCLVLLALFVSLALAGCAYKTRTMPEKKPLTPSLRAGLRSSPYGAGTPFPQPEYWLEAAQSMASRFPGRAPALIWIVGTMEPGEGDEEFTGKVDLTFPSPGGDYPYINFAAADASEEYLTQFDAKGFQVWLQVEPADADMSTLIDLVLGRYSRHPCVIGFGIDVEWNRWSGQNTEGAAVSDGEAQQWCEKVRSYNPAYRLFLKHWLPEKMPPSYRRGLAFVDDSQEFESLTQMVDEFALWGRTFAPSPVGFQFGYNADRKWWKLLADPPLEIGNAILARVTNVSDLIWVDFSMVEIWPRQ